MESQESLKLQLFEMLKKRDTTCADCGAAAPEWASLGGPAPSAAVFVCVECSGVHRQLGVHVSRVKSVRLDNWKAAEVEEMRRNGNAASNGRTLALLEPLRAWYCCPPRLPEDGSGVREQWVRSKYERREWSEGANGGAQLLALRMPVPLVEEWVVKRGAKRKSWKRRWCVVLGSSVAYFAKKGDASPKGVFSLCSVSEVCVVKEEFEGHLHTLQLDCGERPFFLALESGKQLFDWLQIIRAIRGRLVEGKGGNRKAAVSSATELTMRARNELVLRTRRLAKATVDNTFLGAQLIDWLMAVEELTTRDDALVVASEMMALGKFKNASNLSAKDFSDNIEEAYIWQ